MRNMQVALLNSTPDPECIVAAAARLFTSKISSGKLQEKLSSERVNNLLDYIISSGHLSPFEHASFTLAVDGISCATSHQLVRHRIASYTQQSKRYVSLTQISYITPATIDNKGFKTKFHEMVKASCDERQSCGLFPTKKGKVGG